MKAHLPKLARWSNAGFSCTKPIIPLSSGTFRTTLIETMPVGPATCCVRPMKSFQGHLLVASPKLLDPNFYHSVVLIVQHNEQGALGLIINRPVETTIDMVWDQVSETPCLCDDPLHQGGPCEGTLMVLHGDPSLSHVEVISGVYFSTEKDVVEQLVAGDEGDRPVRFFVGYSGWGEGQLETELESGAWLTISATAEQVFEKSDKLWDTLRRRITLQNTCPWIDPNLIPDDPSVN